VFNERAAQLPANVDILTVSTDLPFAQSRFCGAEGIEKLKAVSDHRDANFGKAYGVLITEGPLSRVLSRAVFVIGPDGVLKHAQYVPEVATEPDYDAALASIA
jgi:thiol peroxidase